MSLIFNGVKFPVDKKDEIIKYFIEKIKEQRLLDIRKAIKSKYKQNLIKQYNNLETIKKNEIFENVEKDLSLYIKLSQDITILIFEKNNECYLLFPLSFNVEKEDSSHIRNLYVSNQYDDIEDHFNSYEEKEAVLNNWLELVNSKNGEEQNIKLNIDKSYIIEEIKKLTPDEIISKADIRMKILKDNYNDFFEDDEKKKEFSELNLIESIDLILEKKDLPLFKKIEKEMFDIERKKLSKVHQRLWFNF